VFYSEVKVICAVKYEQNAAKILNYTENIAKSQNIIEQANSDHNNSREDIRKIHVMSAVKYEFFLKYIRL